MENQVLPYDEVVKPSCKYYVYAIYLKDKPNPIYIGKGTGRRYQAYAFKSHLESISNNMLRSKIKKIHNAGEKHLIRILFETDDEAEALDVETFYISYYGRRFDSSGILYNFELDGRVGVNHASWNHKPVYWRGFIFPSIEVACLKLGRGRTTFSRDVEKGLAAYADGESLYNFKDILNDAQLNSTGNTGMSKGITIDGKYFPTLTKAAKFYSYTRGSSLLYFLENCNHNHSYTVHSNKILRGNKKVKIIIDGTLYNSIADAAKVFGYSCGGNLRRFLSTSKHNHTYEIIYD